MRSSATPSQHRPPHERAAYKTAATYVRKSRCCCNRAQLQPRRTRHSVWHKPQCCPPHPAAALDSPSRKPRPSPNPERDPRPRLPPCAPSARLARCPPSEKTSSEFHPLPPPSPPREKPSPQSTDPKSRPIPAEWEIPS